MDAGESSPVATGIRELREETGYEGENARVIGDILPNPAIMANTCYTILVENCRLRHAIAFDHSEDIITRLVPIAESLATWSGPGEFGIRWWSLRFIITNCCLGKAFPDAPPRR